MSRFIIYLFPLLMDMALSTMFFVCSLRMAESGASAFAVSMISTVWALTYSLSAAVAGRLIRPDNAANYVIGSCLAVAVISGLFVLFPGLSMQYVLMIAIGWAVAMFFVPFQVFMKAVMGNTSWGLNVSTGLYTAAWSCGMALGPFVSGLLWQHFNWQICHLINAAAVLGCAWGIFRLRHYAQRPAALPDAAKATPSVKPAASPSSSQHSSEYGRYPDLVMIGWICGTVCFLTVAIIRAVFPSLATALTVSKANQGMVFAILFWAQAGAGLVLCLFRHWMYRRGTIIMVSLSGIIGFLLLGMGRTAPVFFLAALLLGIYTGTISCYFVFHALVHPRKSSSRVAVNETIVGITGSLGPVLGGLVADRSGLSTPFLLAALLLALAAVSFWRGYQKKFSASN
ncbi:MAG: MFS transporter [Victivallales bacterium]|nr:MFS transporter [Victivallales bacterium]